MSKFDNAFKSLFETNMGISPNESILIFSDIIRKDEEILEDEKKRRELLNKTAKELSLFAEKNYGKSIFVDFFATDASGVEPPEALWLETFGQKTLQKLKDEGFFEKLIKMS